MIIQSISNFNLRGHDAICYEIPSILRMLEVNVGGKEGLSMRRYAHDNVLGLTFAVWQYHSGA